MKKIRLINIKIKEDVVHSRLRQDKQLIQHKWPETETGPIALI